MLMAGERIELSFEIQRGWEALPEPSSRIVGPLGQRLYQMSICVPLKGSPVANLAAWLAT